MIKAEYHGKSLTAQKADAERFLYLYYTMPIGIIARQRTAKNQIKKEREQQKMEIQEVKKKTVARLRMVKKEKDLTISKIMDMLEANGCYISEGTVKRVFSENADPVSFKYHDTIAPLADVLLDMYSDRSGSEDVAALKAMIHDKNKTINILIARDEERRIEYDKRLTHLQRQIEKLEQHLDFREKVIQRKDEVIERLLNKVIGE